MKDQKDQPQNEPASLRFPTPPGICNACLHNPARTMLAGDSGVLITHCEHGMTGGFIYLGNESPMWTLYSPISPDSWADLIASVTAEIVHRHSTQPLDTAPRLQ